MDRDQVIEIRERALLIVKRTSSLKVKEMAEYIAGKCALELEQLDQKEADKAEKTDISQL